MAIAGNIRKALRLLKLGSNSHVMLDLYLPVEEEPGPPARAWAESEAELVAKTLDAARRSLAPTIGQPPFHPGPTAPTVLVRTVETCSTRSSSRSLRSQSQSCVSYPHRGDS